MPLNPDDIKSFFNSYCTDEVKSLEKLPKSGGDRVYFRIHTNDKSFIATYNEKIKENEAFFNFTSHLRNIKAPLPEIFKIDTAKEMYLQEDFGNTSLLNELEKNGYNDYVYTLFKKSLKELAW